MGWGDGDHQDCTGAALFINVNVVALLFLQIFSPQEASLLNASETMRRSIHPGKSARRNVLGN